MLTLDPQAIDMKLCIVRFSYPHQLFLCMQVAVQQHLLMHVFKRAAIQQHRAEAVRSFMHVHGVEQDLTSTIATDVTTQLTDPSSEGQNLSSASQRQCGAPAKWRTSDPWFTWAAMTVAVGALAFSS